MHRIVKIVFLIIIAAFGLFCAFGFGVEAFRYIESPSNHFETNNSLGIFIIIPLVIFLLSIPSFLFQLYTLKYLKKEQFNGDLDSSEDLLDNILLETNTFKVSNFLWISNLLFGLIVLAIGGILIYALIDDPPSDEDSAFQITIYSITVVIIAAGVLMLLEEWILKRKYVNKKK